MVSTWELEEVQLRVGLRESGKFTICTTKGVRTGRSRRDIGECEEWKSKDSKRGGVEILG